MNNLEYIHTVYKNLVKAVALEQSGPGFHFLKQSILKFR